MKICVNRSINLLYDLETNTFSPSITMKEYVKYLKGTYTNKERLMDRYISLYDPLFAHEDVPKDMKPKAQAFLDKILEMYDQEERFSFAEAFKVGSREFMAVVFSSISIAEMVESLGGQRIKTAGMPVKRKQYDTEGNFTGYREYDNIYEVWEASGEKLGLGSEKIYALKVWCTSTNKEHFLWIDDKFKDDPLEAVASTFRVHKNLIPYIKELKRQGDIMIMELTQDVEPEGEIVPLTKDQYFGFLTAES